METLLQDAIDRDPVTARRAHLLKILLHERYLTRRQLIVRVEGLLGKTIGITKLRGTWKTYRNIPLMPTYHPSYLLRKQTLSEKRNVWEDMLQVMERLALPISEKQRKFFAKA